MGSHPARAHPPEDLSVPRETAACAPLPHISRVSEDIGLCSRGGAMMFLRLIIGETLVCSLRRRSENRRTIVTGGEWLGGELLAVIVALAAREPALAAAAGGCRRGPGPRVRGPPSPGDTTQDASAG